MARDFLRALLVDLAIIPETIGIMYRTRLLLLLGGAEEKVRVRSSSIVAVEHPFIAVTVSNNQALVVLECIQLRMMMQHPQRTK